MTNDNFKKLMLQWNSALESYGTPGDFADKSYIELLISDDESKIPIRKLVAGGYAIRGELMEIQRNNSDRRKKENSLERWTNDGSSCFLCDNTGQAKDIGDNLLLPFDTFEDYVLVPNRYPMARGHLLLCAKEHDLTGFDNSTLTPGLFEIIVKVAEDYNLSLERNNSKAGMSIPDHEHIHYHPRFLRSSVNQININGLINCTLQKTDFGNEVYSILETDFDTLAFKGEQSIGKVHDIATKFEGDDIIFTFSYDPSSLFNSDGTFFMTPHKKQDDKGRIAANTPLYFKIVREDDKTTYDEFMELHKEHIFSNGSFDWGKYF